MRYFSLATLTILMIVIVSPVAHAEFTSTPNASWPTAGGLVSAVVVASDGSAYIGGQFTSVGYVIRNRLAHILSDGTVDPDFDPNIGGAVRALALHEEGGVHTLYVGGSFTTVNGGTTRNRIAAFTPLSSSVATSFDPDADSIVNALAISSDGNTLYVGGFFFNV